MKLYHVPSQSHFQQYVKSSAIINAFYPMKSFQQTLSIAQQFNEAKMLVFAPMNGARKGYPKIFSKTNLVGKSNPAFKYRLRVWGSFHMRYTKRRFVLSTHAG